VGDGDGDAEGVAEGVLQLVLPGSGSIAVGASAVGEDDEGGSVGG